MSHEVWMVEKMPFFSQGMGMQITGMRGVTEPVLRQGRKIAIEPSAFFRATE